jgi:hypothetical protein
MDNENSSEHLYDPKCSTNNSSDESDFEMVSNHIYIFSLYGHACLFASSECVLAHYNCAIVSVSHLYVGRAR